jgi:hypothetical protein
MSRTLNRLKPLAVDRAKSPGRYADGGGLYLIVKPGPRKSWAFIYRHGTKMTELGLGGIASVALVAARAEAAELREVLSQGSDPRAHRERKRQAKALEDARSVTFEAAARSYLRGTSQIGAASSMPASGCARSRSMSSPRSAVLASAP